MADSFVLHIMLIMSQRASDAQRLIRLKFYGTLAGRGEHVASKSSPNQQPKVADWKGTRKPTRNRQ